MSKNLSYITTMMLAAVIGMAASCISDDEVDSTSECFINGFAVKDITSTLHTLTDEGIDSTYKLTIGGSNIKFNIDQVNGRIYSVDSLPSWTDLSRVVPSVSFSGNLYVMIDSVYYQTTGSGDSLDMTKPLDFIVVSTDGTSIKHYTAEIHLATVNTDSLLWTRQTNADIQLADIHRLIAFDGTMYAYGTHQAGEALTTSTDGAHWTSPATITPDIDPTTICTLAGKLYATDTDANIHTSTDGAHWTPTGQSVQRLLGADNFCIYALREGKIMATADLAEWKTAGTRNLTYLPTHNISILTYPTHTNPNLMVDVMIGLTPGQANALTWYKVAADEQTGSDQQWDYIAVTAENKYPLPALADIAVTHFGGALYAMGGDNSQYYRSDDNGITWHQVTRYQFPPPDIQPYKPVATVTCNDYVWMMQTATDGTVNIWKGKLNN